MNATSAPEPPIEVRSLTRVARGKNRDIYFIPQGTAIHSGALVLKVPRYAARNNRLALPKRALRGIFPQSRRRVIGKEASYLARLSNSLSSHSDTLPIPAFHGFVETTAGTGALWEAICNEDGGLAPTLEDVAKAGQMAATIEPLNAFAAVCYGLNIVAPDINDRNLALRTWRGRQEIVLVDGFGDHRMISLRTLWRSRNIRSLDDRFQKVARKTGVQFDTNARRFFQ